MRSAAGPAWARAFPAAALEKGRIWIEYLSVARWLRDQDLWPKSRVQGGREVFQAVAAPIAWRPVLFLEFGVFKGYTMSQWSVLLKNPASRLIGFDSFEGLPEDWAADYPKGTFNARRRGSGGQRFVGDAGEGLV